MGLDNLLLARWLAEAGDTTRAFAASLRVMSFRPVTDEPEATSLYIDYLREQARLAAAVGEIDAARRSYRVYLALRDHPEGSAWQATRDSVRRELEALGKGVTRGP